MRNQNSKVYFAKCVLYDGRDMGIVKVGVSRDPELRMHSLEAGAPYNVKEIISFPGCTMAERFCQLWLRSSKARGEYFHATEEVFDFIVKAEEAGGIPFNVKFIEDDFTFPDCLAFMNKYGISFEEMQKLTGSNLAGQINCAKKGKHMRRAFAADLTVMAVKKGFDIDWNSEAFMDVVL